MFFVNYLPIKVFKVLASRVYFKIIPAEKSMFLNVSLR